MEKAGSYCRRSLPFSLSRFSLPPPPLFTPAAQGSKTRRKRDKIAISRCFHRAHWASLYVALFIVKKHIAVCISIDHHVMKEEGRRGWRLNVCFCVCVNESTGWVQRYLGNCRLKATRAHGECFRQSMAWRWAHFRPFPCTLTQELAGDSVFTWFWAKFVSKIWYLPWPRARFLARAMSITSLSFRQTLAWC